MSLSTYKPVATMITCREDDEEAMVMLSAYRELERENASLRERLDSVQKSHFTLSKDNAALRELTSTLGAPNHINIPVDEWRELREDKERLDYMEKNVDFVSWMYCGKPHSWDFRKKIDAKRKEAEP